MKTKHTPGPWKSDCNIIRNNENHTIASTHFTQKGVELIEDTSWDKEKESWLDYRNRTESKRERETNIQFSNANLMAAAPEMLEALEFIYKYYSEGFDGWPDNYMGKSEIETIINSAIKKATGE